MLERLLPYFTEELIKIAKVTAASKVEEHHRADKKDWKAFDKNIRSKAFRKAVHEHPESDEKLRSYVKAVGEYRDSKDVVGHALSRSGGRKHRVKKLPGGRLGCSCKDWQYKHSHAKTDCAHIIAVRDSWEKKHAARVEPQHLLLPRARKSHDRGEIMQENLKRLRSGHPLIPLDPESHLHTALVG